MLSLSHTSVVEYSCAGRLQDVLRCKKLVARGEDINEALHFAIGRGRLEIVAVFIQVRNSEFASQPSNFGLTLSLSQAGADLHTAIKTGDYYDPAPGEGGEGGGGGKKGSKKKGSKKKSKKKK